MKLPADALACLVSVKAQLERLTTAERREFLRQCLAELPNGDLHWLTMTAIRNEQQSRIPADEMRRTDFKGKQ